MTDDPVIEESVLVHAPPDEVYAAVADLRRMGEWSPECFRIWVPGGVVRPGAAFVGFNRIGRRFWFTTCRVTTARPGEEFAFRVTLLGIPAARWGYRFEADGDGATRLTEYFLDLRRGFRGSRLWAALGDRYDRVPPGGREQHNRAGMRTTLERVKRAIESPPPGTR
ncbi:SRPBCC family protein [Actinomadura kijaniata]|uniref:SRPBCC family protein n=1 Tax=Actinomadura kijaniata TaxID=46161 RepID=UPI000833FC02|nr:SRPBCC family protein [Actinomadura kijaniata]